MVDTSGSTIVEVNERTALVPGKRATGSSSSKRVLYAVACALVCTTLAVGIASQTPQVNKWVTQVGWFVWPEYSIEHCDVSDGDIYTRLGLVKHFENHPQVVLADQRALHANKINVEKGKVLVIVDSPTNASDLSVTAANTKPLLARGFKAIWADDIFESRAVMPAQVHGLPLGVRSSTFCQYKAALFNAIQTMTPFKEKPIKALANFHLKGADFLERTKMPSGFNFNPRKEAIDILQKNAGDAVHWQEQILDIPVTYRSHKDFAFELSPFGNGIDCYRTWEALLLQTVPIVKSEGHKNDILYEGLPIVVVNDWHEVTQENLEKWHQQFLNTDWEMVRKTFGLSRYVQEIEDAVNGAGSQ